MKTEEFNYYLPEELIANYPLEDRSASRLMVYENQLEHKNFSEVKNYFKEGDILVLN